MSSGKIAILFACVASGTGGAESGDAELGSGVPAAAVALARARCLMDCNNYYLRAVCLLSCPRRKLDSETLPMRSSSQYSTYPQRTRGSQGYRGLARHGVSRGW